MIYMRVCALFIMTTVVALNACTGEESRREGSGDTTTYNVAPEREDPDAAPGAASGMSGMTAEDLRDAAYNGRLAQVKEAVEQGVDVQGADQLGRTALMFASYNGHTDIVRYLLDQGADVHSRNQEDRTPLMFAASGPFPDTVELLLEEGAETDIKDNVEGWSALMFAASEGNLEVVQILLEYGADVSLRDNDEETAIDFAQNSGHTEIVTLLENNL